MDLVREERLGGDVKASVAGLVEATSASIALMARRDGTIFVANDLRCQRDEVALRGEDERRRTIQWCSVYGMKWEEK